MDDEKFIHLVKQYEYLFNKHHPYFKIQHRKMEAWRRIGEQMGISDKLCMRRWTTLRDKYVRLKRKMRSLSPDETLQDWPWPLLDLMEFLAPHIISRPNRYSYDIVSVDFEPGKSPFSEEPSMSDTFPKFAKSLPLTSPTESPAEQPPERKRKKRLEEFKMDNTDAIIDTVTDSDNEPIIGTVETPKKEVEIKNTSLRGFGQMILGLMSDMDQRKQLMAIKSITDVVTKIMLEPEETTENDFFENTE
ncbi:uncharacterized protein LOC119639749 isoform X1 [Glossina fuscipes]|uniref:Uncharacterized protein LOC119639749 isoform X1 n=3 Tax=Glossina fuscipes TaxID=7396 RepID=A0A9C6DVV2_9MUSC|nr:uncharacterized protein LOC119639749 isoform X1 [Glossina fuscipes]